MSGCLLNLGDKLLKRRPRSLLMLGQINGGCPEAREVGVGKILGFVRGQDFQRKVFG